MKELLDFEWDPAKDASNWVKHGITFSDAARVFDDPRHLITDSTKPEYGKVRMLAVGRVDDRFITVIFTERKGSYASFPHGEFDKMNDNTMIKARRLVDGSIVQVLPDGTTRPFTQRSDWARVDAMTEQEVEANALSDPDNPPLTPSQLANLRRVPNLREIRDHLHMTQEQFSREFDLPIGTVRDWEQGLKKPDRAARTLLRVIAHNPDAVIEALKA